MHPLGNVSLPPNVSSNHPRQQRVSAFYTYANRALRICPDYSSLNSETNFLKYLALSRGYNPSIIDRAVWKFGKSRVSSSIDASAFNVVVLYFFSSLCYKVSNLLSRFGFRVVFRPVKFNFPSLRDPISVENRWSVYFNPRERDLDYIDQTRPALRFRLKEPIIYFTNYKISSFHLLFLLFLGAVAFALIFLKQVFYARLTKY